MSESGAAIVYRKTGIPPTLYRRVLSRRPQRWSGVVKKWMNSTYTWDELNAVTEFCSSGEALEIMDLCKTHR